MINTVPRGGLVASQSEPRMTNVRGDAFGLGSIGRKIKEDGFSYKTAFKKAYLTGESRNNNNKKHVGQIVMLIPP